MAKSNIKPKPEIKTNQVKTNIPKNLYSLYTSEFSQLTPDYVKRYLEMARKGLNFYKGILFDEIRRRDMAISAACQTRKMSILKRAYHFESEWEEGKGFIEGLFKGLNFSNFMTDIVEAQIQGVSGFEIIWDIVEGKMVPVSVPRIPSHLLAYDDLENVYYILDAIELDQMQIRMTSMTTDDRINLNQFKKLEMPEDKLIIIKALDGDSFNGFTNGAVDALVFCYMFKSYAIKDWACYLEKYAVPYRVGKFKRLSDNKLMNDFQTAVEDFGNNGWITMPDDFSIEFLGSNNAGNDALFTNHVNYWNEQIAIRILGQSLTTQNTTGTGSYAMAQVHDQVRMDIMASDLMLIQQTVNDLIQKVIDFNFASAPEYPELIFDDIEDVEYQKKKSEIIKNLKDAGYVVSVEDVENEFGYEIEEAETPEPTPAPEPNPEPESEPEPEPEPKPKGFAEIDDTIEKLIEEIATEIDKSKEGEKS